MKRVSLLVVLTVLVASALAVANPGGVCADVRPPPILVPPSITLSPTSGFSTVTISGQGFDGQIRIYWEQQLIPTVPSPVYAGNDGTFTAIISVPTQTRPGRYSVSVEGGKVSATATFTVFDMTGATGPVGPAGPAGDPGPTARLSVAALVLAVIAPAIIIVGKAKRVIVG